MGLKKSCCFLFSLQVIVDQKIFLFMRHKIFLYLSLMETLFWATPLVYTTKPYTHFYHKKNGFCSEISSFSVWMIKVKMKVSLSGLLLEASHTICSGKVCPFYQIKEHKKCLRWSANCDWDILDQQKRWNGSLHKKLYNEQG